MNRKQFIKRLISGTAIIGMSSGGYMLITGEKDMENLTIEASLAILDAMANKTIITNGEWNAYQVFTHCAQSVEYSMSSFPEHKSKLFKNTVGILAFSIFSSRGKMSHGLSEPIPGAPEIASKNDTQKALVQLRKTLVDFQKYEGKLKPHFAYGTLSKEEYALAHALHLNNHLEEFSS